MDSYAHAGGVPLWIPAASDHAAADGAPADPMQQAELQHHHHGAIDPNLDPVMDDQLRRLRHDLADGAHALHDDATAADPEAPDDGRQSSAQPPTGPPLAFHNLVHPPPSSSNGDDAGVRDPEHAAVEDPGHLSSSSSATLLPPPPTSASTYTPGPFNPYPDPSAPPAAAAAHPLSQQQQQQQPLASGSAGPSVTPYKRKEPSAEDEEKRKKQNQLKRAEQNRQAQRAFRERREKHMADLEAKARQLHVAKVGEADALRKVQLASNVIAQLRIENDNLKATVARLTAQLAGGGEAPPAEGTVGEALPCEEHGEQGVLQGEAEGQPRGVEEQPVPAETAP